MPHKHDLLIELLRDVNRGFGEQMKKVLEEHKVPMTTMIITGQIKKEPGITVSELARRTGFAKSHISKVVENLEKKGWMEKRPDRSDQRLARLFLSQDAVDRLAVVREQVQREMAGIIAHVSENRVAEMVAGLKEILAALESARRSDNNGHHQN